MKNPKVPEDGVIPSPNKETKTGAKTLDESSESAKPETRTHSGVAANTDGFKQVSELVFGQNLQDRVSNVSIRLEYLFLDSVLSCIGILAMCGEQKLIEIHRRFLRVVLCSDRIFAIE